MTLQNAGIVLYLLVFFGPLLFGLLTSNARWRFWLCRIYAVLFVVSAIGSVFMFKTGDVGTGFMIALAVFLWWQSTRVFSEKR